MVDGVGGGGGGRGGGGQFDGAVRLGPRHLALHPPNKLNIAQLKGRGILWACVLDSRQFGHNEDTCQPQTQMATEEDLSPG